MGKFISPHFLMQPATHPQIPKENGLVPPSHAFLQI